MSKLNTKKMLFPLIFVSLLIAFALWRNSVHDAPVGQPSGLIVQSAPSVRWDSAAEAYLTHKESMQLDTHITIGILDENEISDEFFQDLVRKIDEYEAVFSRHREGAELYHLNSKAGRGPVKVSELLWPVLEKGLNSIEKTRGYFDVTIGELLILWDISGLSPSVPDEDVIQETLNRHSNQWVELHEETQSVSFSEDLIMDLGGIAKGHIADLLAADIQEAGYHRAIINLGGDVRVLGEKAPGLPWIVGVRNPFGGDPLGAVPAVNEAVVSSGSYERYFEEAGVRYHHMINPHTGYPEDNELVSVVVVSDTAMDGDIFSTALFIMGLEEGLAFAENHQEIEAIFVTYDKSIYLTEGLKGKFRLMNPDFEVANPLSF